LLFHDGAKFATFIRIHVEFT